MMRTELLDVRLVAYRGLWDKFAAPRTLAAFVRARRRRIPFLIDLDSSELTISDLEPLIDQSDVLAFLMAKELTTLRDIATSDNVCLIDRGATGTVFPIENTNRNRCGYYVPLDATARVTPRDIPVRRGDLLLYESVDTIQSLFAMRMSRIKSDEPAETRLAFAQSDGAIMMKVADLVELELLVDSMRWVVR